MEVVRERPCRSQGGDSASTTKSPLTPSSSFVPLAAAWRPRRAKPGGSWRWRAILPHARGSPIRAARRPGRRVAGGGEGRRGDGPGFLRQGWRSRWLHGQHSGRNSWCGVTLGIGAAAPDDLDVGRRGGMAARPGRRWIWCLSRWIWRAWLLPWPLSSGIRLVGKIPAGGDLRA
jgi:hypothetical protein